MKHFDFTSLEASPNDIVAEMERVREYIRNAPDPNETEANGRTLLQLALISYVTDEGKSLVADLLERGADPNRPTAWANFTLLLTVSNSLPLVQAFVDRGLRLNDVYRTSIEKGALTEGPSTLLDYVYAIRDYISPRRKKLNALANKYAGGLGKRRRFIDETIALLESRGAKRAQDLSHS
jgi:hypothetical protein